jgi:3-deoxy-D-manno-octulosonic-acid transferase
MILAFASFLSSALNFPIRAFASFLGRIVPNPKARIFFIERSKDHFTQQLNFARRTKTEAIKHDSPTIFWLHVSSAGELEQVIPVMRALHERLSVQFFVTYFSPSTKPFLKNCPGIMGSTSLPAEDKDAYTQIIGELNISRLLLVRYDFWPTLIHTAKKKNVPIAVLAATLARARSILPDNLQTLSKLFWFKHADLLFLVSEKDKTRLVELDFSPEITIVSGDAKWARAKERAQIQKEQAQSTALQLVLSHLVSGPKSEKRKTLIFGSPHEDELLILKWCLEQFTAPCLFIVAPAEVDEKTLSKLEQGLDLRAAQSMRLSDMERSLDALPLVDENNHTVLILDSFGQLAAAYAEADCAIVGGGFDGQLHNVLEPAAYPVLTLFGNQTGRAPEAQILLDHNAAISFVKPDAMFDFLRRWSSLSNRGVGRSPNCPEFEHTLKGAQRLFGSLPNTSEVICRAIAHRHKLEIG